MGGGKFALNSPNLEQVSGFSTVESSYPHFSMTYPQFAHRIHFQPASVTPRCGLEMTGGDMTITLILDTR